MNLGSIPSSTEVYTKAQADSAISVSVQSVQVGGATDATVLTKGVVQLAGDLAGTAAAPTVPGLAGKEASISAGTTSQYWRGDKSWPTLDKSAVGLANIDNTSDANKPISTATQTALNAKAPLVSPSFTTPSLGVATATSVAATGALTSSGTVGIGYAAGAGGTVTQATSKSTGVTLNKITGTITLNPAALAANTTVTFTLTNSAIAATDVLILNHVSGGTAGAYAINAQRGAGTATINVRNITAGSLSEAIVIGFAVIKAVTA